MHPDRGPLFAKGIGILLAAGYFLYCASTPTNWHFIDFVDLIFHEAGHTIFSFFGLFIHVLMGSGFQVLLPLFVAGYFFYTNQRLSAAVTLMWVGYNLVNVSVYARDSIVMELPLLGGDSSGHDWNYLLSTTHLLVHTYQIADGINAVGIGTILLGLCLGRYFLFQANRSSRSYSPSQ